MYEVLADCMCEKLVFFQADYSKKNYFRRKPNEFPTNFAILFPYEKLQGLSCQKVSFQSSCKQICANMKMAKIF